MSWTSSFLSLASSSSSSAGVVDWCTFQGDPSVIPVAAVNQCNFYYQPNQGAAITGVVVFALLSLVHLTLNLTRRMPLMGFITATACMEVGGYIARVMLIHSNVDNGFLVMTIFLVIAPNLFALVNYVVLGRVIQACIPPVVLTPGKVEEAHPHPWLRWLVRADGMFQPRFVACFFLLSDLGSLVIQSVAASFLTSTTPGDPLTGQHIMTGGLAIPLFFFTCFFVIALVVYTRPVYGIRYGQGLPAMRRVFVGLLVTISVLMARNVYRFLEYAIGTDGWVATHEAMFYIFDTLMVTVALITYATCDFALYLPRAAEEMRRLHEGKDAGMGRKQTDLAAHVEASDSYIPQHELTSIQVRPADS